MLWGLLLSIKMMRGETDKLEFPVGIQIKVVNIFSIFNNSL